MNKFKQFYKFCKCYQTQLVGEQLLKQLGFELNEGPFLNNIDELISMIPELLFNEHMVGFSDRLIFNN